MPQHINSCQRIVILREHSNGAVQPGIQCELKELAQKFGNLRCWSHKCYQSVLQVYQAWLQPQTISAAWTVMASDPSRDHKSDSAKVVDKHVVKSHTLRPLSFALLGRLPEHARKCGCIPAQLLSSARWSSPVRARQDAQVISTINAYPETLKFSNSLILLGRLPK